LTGHFPRYSLFPSNLASPVFHSRISIGDLGFWFPLSSSRSPFYVFPLPPTNASCPTFFIETYLFPNRLFLPFPPSGEEFCRTGFEGISLPLIRFFYSCFSNQAVLSLAFFCQPSSLNFLLVSPCPDVKQVCNTLRPSSPFGMPYLGSKISIFPSSPAFFSGLFFSPRDGLIPPCLLFFV